LELITGLTPGKPELLDDGVVAGIEAAEVIAVQHLDAPVFADLDELVHDGARLIG
jgi:hypothetical protein